MLALHYHHEEVYAANPKITMIKATVEFLRAELAAKGKVDSRSIQADALAGHTAIPSCMSVEQWSITFGTMVPWGSRAQTHIEHPGMNSKAELPALKKYQEAVSLKYSTDALGKLAKKYNVVYSMSQFAVCP
jgi:hypothetical protein